MNISDRHQHRYQHKSNSCSQPHRHTSSPFIPSCAVRPDTGTIVCTLSSPLPTRYRSPPHSTSINRLLPPSDRVSSRRISALSSMRSTKHSKPRQHPSGQPLKLPRSRSLRNLSSNSHPLHSLFLFSDTEPSTKQVASVAHQSVVRRSLIHSNPTEPHPPTTERHWSGAIGSPEPVPSLTPTGH